jgi:hypothetical protein
VQTNVTLYSSWMLAVTNTATDADLPANSLSYLLAVAPAGATIDSSGVIQWDPPAVQAATSFTFTTVVTDNNPAAVNSKELSTTNTFVATVLPSVHRGPMLPNLSSQTIYGTAPMVVYNTAYYADVPPTPLTYVLLTAPTNAVIDGSGVIRWTPTVAQVPGNYMFETKVSDAAVPSLSSTNSFVVYVLPQPGPEVPILGPISLSNSLVTLTWSSLSGRSYRVEYNEDLGGTNWLPAGPDVPSGGTLTTTSLSNQNAPHRFYRVLLLP